VGDPYDHSNLVWDDKVGGYVRDNRLAETYTTKTHIPRQQGGH
jgi:hypothetical protein